MTQKLTELLNLAPIAEEITPESPSVEEQQILLSEAISINERIDSALPFVNDLDSTDKELDELADLAKAKFEDLIDLGMNVEARFSGTILQTAGTLLGHAITARQAKIDRKIRTIDLQLKKMRLDLQSQKTDGSKLLEAEDGKGVVLDRNELLAQLLSASKTK